MTLERPMFPPSSRRGFFAIAGGAAVATATAAAVSPAFADSRKALDGSEASPALRAAVTALIESNDRLEAAKARFAATDLTVSEWGAKNPRPTSKRAIKRWARKMRDYRDDAQSDAWQAQLAAEKDFGAAQLAVARVTPRDENDLALKAAVAFVYDRVKTASGYSIAIISYSVAQDLLKSRRMLS